MEKELFRPMKLKDIRRRLTDKNAIDLYYIVDNKFTLVFSVTREIVGRKAQFRIYCHLDIEFALQNYFLKRYSNKAEDFEANSFLGDRKNIYARINFTKKVFIKFTEDEFIMNTDELFPKLIEDLYKINTKRLSYKELYRQDHNTNKGRVIKWTRDLCIECVWACFEFLGIKFIAANNIFTWWYLGYTMTTRIISFERYSVGTCYKPFTSINDKKANNEFNDGNSNHWVYAAIFAPINTINLLNNIGKYSEYTKLDDFNKIDSIIKSFSELDGNITYYPDDCFEDNEEREEYKLKGFKLFSDKPNFEDICTRMEILFGRNIKDKLLELGYTKLILGYYSYLDFYVHPVRHSAIRSWRYANPFVLDVESGLVSYCILRDNQVLGYEKAKIKDDKLIVTASVPSSDKYGYILDLY